MATIALVPGRLTWATAFVAIRSSGCAARHESFHAKELTVDSFRAWEASVVPDGLVVFHDYGEWWPGVREAVEELGLEETAKAGLFVWRKDALPS